ncbi:MAG: hypothetical protein HY646_15915, partial [Acidobacteria bacterium]|nr:hypothetical protein [Acidobacteriota bacterium]
MKALAKVVAVLGLGLVAVLTTIASQTTGAYPLPPPQPPLEQRTEAEARRVAEGNRADRERRRVADSAPVELISNYVRSQVGPVPASLGVSPFYKKYVDA